MATITQLSIGSPLARPLRLRIGRHAAARQLPIVTTSTSSARIRSLCAGQFCGCTSIPGPSSSRSLQTRYASSASRPRSPIPPSPSTSPSTPTPAPTPSHHLPLPRTITPRRALLLLRIPIPPAHWPSHLELSSPLLLRLSTALKSAGVAVNAVYDGVGSVESFYPAIGAEEGYAADLYLPDGQTVRYERLEGKDVGVVKGDLESALGRQGEGRLSVGDGDGMGKLMRKGKGKGGEVNREKQDVRAEMEVLVCTHGSRDCRCEQTGGALVRALRAEIEQRGMGNVRVSEIAHVGGHKYAANAILLPSLDMLSNLLPSDAPALLSHILAGRPADSAMWKHWRGRYGLTEVEQEGVWNGTDAAHAEERVAEAQGKAGQEMDTANERMVGGGSKVEGVKYRLRFKTHAGEVREVQAQEGETLLQVAKREGLPAMEGTCGGNLECATCHLYIPSSAPTLPESEDELDMLGYALGYKDGESRLGCQVKVTPELGKWSEGGGVLQLPRF